MTTQPKAIALADRLLGDGGVGHCYPFHASADELRRQHAEIERLTSFLNNANAKTEEFERKWYLCCDEIERLEAVNAELEKSVKLQAGVMKKALAELEEMMGVKAELLEALKCLLDQDDHGEDEISIRIKARAAIKSAEGKA